MFNIKENIPELVDMYDMSNLFNNRVEDTFIQKFGHTIDNIKIVKNGISENDVERALKVLKSYPTLSERDHCYSTFHIPGFKPCEDHNEFAEYMKPKLISIAEKEFGEKLLPDRPFLYMTHPTGSHIGAHTDILTIDYKNNDPEKDDGPTQEEQLKAFENMWSGHLAILAYLNDDYEGGYLYFPEFDYYIKPSAGDVVIFPGSLYYVHGVSTVTEGIRYTLSQWTQFDFYAKN
jgi:hypothetical protein